MLTLTEQLQHKPFPDVANAIRNRTTDILEHWHELVLEVLPHIDKLTVKDFENDIAAILALAADSLELDDWQGISDLFAKAPAHGFDRFLQKYELTDMLTEHRILRGVIIIEVEDALGHPMTAAESASMNAIVDVMFQQGTLMMVKKQKERLRDASEAELKFLAYFSHDLGNQLCIISFSLEALDRRIRATPHFEDEHNFIEAAQQSITRTTEGMHRLLDHERLRRSKKAAFVTEVNLSNEFSKTICFFSEQAKAKGMQVRNDADPDAAITVDAELLYIILQNLVGNAIKHCDNGEVRLAAQREEAEGGERWQLSVTDQGSGIKPEQLEKIFDAFEQGDALSVEGVGLGCSPH